MGRYVIILKMKRRVGVRLASIGLSLVAACLYAAEPEPVLSQDFLPTKAIHANWVFSGLVTSEQGEQFGYFFEMQRDDNQFHVKAALFDSQTKAPIVIEDESAVISDASANNWHVGRAFLRFNSVNDSWVFGLKTNDKKGFNFKVDMLTSPGVVPMTQTLRPGVEFMVNQTNRLNGHLWTSTDNQETFVTAKNAWFRQVWLTNTQETRHSFTGVLCRFDNGSGFYSVNMQAPDAVHGAVAGWSDDKGLSTPISQFIHVKQESSDASWHIRIASPNLHLIFSDLIKQDTVVAGFMTQGKHTGFCMLSKDKIGFDVIERRTLVAEQTLTELHQSTSS